MNIGGGGERNGGGGITMLALVRHVNILDGTPLLAEWAATRPITSSWRGLSRNRRQVALAGWDFFLFCGLLQARTRLAFSGRCIHRWIGPGLGGNLWEVA